MLRGRVLLLSHPCMKKLTGAFTKNCRCVSCNLRGLAADPAVCMRPSWRAVSIALC